MPSRLFFRDKSPVKFSPEFEREFDRLMGSFKDFVSEIEDKKIVFEGFFSESGDYAKKVIDLVYSFHQKYKNRYLAKMYKLNDWYNGLPVNKKSICMLTLTTYQKELIRDNKRRSDGHVLPYFAQYDLLRDSWLKLKDVLKKPKHLGNFDYFVIPEPHETGFAHYHIIIFKYVPSPEIAYIRKMWNEKYGAGSDHYGVNFTFVQKGALRSLKNYLMKYASKGLSLSRQSFSEYFDDSDLKRAEIPKDDYPLWVFNAVKWYMNRRDTPFKGFRTFMASKNLNRVMSLSHSSSNSVIWDTVSIVTSAGSRIIKKRNPDTGKLERVSGDNETGLLSGSLKELVIESGAVVPRNDRELFDLRAAAESMKKFLSRNLIGANIIS